ncbi:reverse transcriptase [Cucumis melo var. makuwa]|uniref:Reverse transcriptase n=1 Tax=Cucumis melo var. makuwa TaxID=1194695 RepID=A0A5A7TPZ6_CUCMM|nr:reverse transcriptase [Cucumis melo var. makuwa]TYK29353.1 reverse transcriptase [Cucumis melo var. makuwa]
MLFTFIPSYLWGGAILTAAHLINKVPSRILHLQTPLECLEESYLFTHIIYEVPLHVFGCTAYVHNFGPDKTKFTSRAQTCVFVGHPLHQHGYKCFHLSSRKYLVAMDVTFFPWNLRKEVRSPTSQPSALVQDSEPPRNQEEKNSGDEIEVRIETNNNEAEYGHIGKLDKHDPYLDLPIALKKGTRSCTKHSISNYVSYENLSSQFRAFTASLDCTTIPKNIHIALECPKWKNAVMEEMKALEKNNT